MGELVPRPQSNLEQIGRPELVAVVIFVPVIETFVVPAIMILIPAVIVGETATIAFPVAFKEALAIVMRRHPDCPGIRRTGPISFMPSIMALYRIPIARNPCKIGTGLNRPDREHSRRGRSADLNAN